MLSRREPARAHGFTLIETVVVVTILGLLIMLGLPGMLDWIQNVNIRNASESLGNGLTRARVEALKRNGPVQFSLVSLADARKMDSSCALSASSGSWVISLSDPSSACGAAASQTTAPRILEKHPAGDGNLRAAISAVAIDAGGNKTAATNVVFDGFGRISGSAGAINQIDITAPTGGSSRSLRINVTSSGAVRVCDPAVTDGADPRKC